MRGAYHPLAGRPVRVYSAVHVGGRVTVDRQDLHYVAPINAVGPGEPHPLLFREHVDRGYRLRLADTLGRSYDDGWPDWAAGGEGVSERYVAMRDRHVDACRSDRRAFHYGEVECVDPGDPDTPRPCVTHLRLEEPFPYPATVATLTYETDVAGAGDVDWGPGPSGLRDFDPNVVAMQRTLFERQDDEARWLIGQPSTVETERCDHPEPTDYGQVRCSLGSPDVVRRRTGLEYLEDRPSAVIREPQRQFDLEPDGTPTSLYRRTTFGYTRGLVTDITVESAAGDVRHRAIELDTLERQFPSVLRSDVGGYVLEESFGWQPDLGVVTVHRAPNGAESLARYDGVGRLRGARDPEPAHGFIDAATGFVAGNLPYADPYEPFRAGFFGFLYDAENGFIISYPEGDDDTEPTLVYLRPPGPCTMSGRWDGRLERVTPSGGLDWTLRGVLTVEDGNATFESPDGSLRGTVDDNCALELSDAEGTERWELQCDSRAHCAGTRWQEVPDRVGEHRWVAVFFQG